MSLELKHLAPYLPYGLRVEILNWKSDYVGIRTSTLNGFYDLAENPHFTYVGGSTGKSFKEFKPILRPMSDLSKNVEGECNKHSINILISENFNVEYGTFSCYNGMIMIQKDGDPDLEYDDDVTVNFHIFRFIESELLKNHFDVFNLIGKELAIDINTI